MLRALLALIFAFSIGAPAASAQGVPPGGQTEWYYIASNQVLGGYSLSEMQDMTTRGIIRPATQVYDPAAGWGFAKDTPALQRYLADAAPPVPSAPPPAYPPAPAAPAYPSDPVPPSAPAPASGGTVQAEMDAHIAAFLEGGWRAVKRENMGGRVFETTIEFHFRRDGTYDGFMSTAMPDAPDLLPLTEPMRGQWTARALNPDSFILTTDNGSGLPPDQMALKIEGDAAMVSSDGGTRFDRVP